MPLWIPTRRFYANLSEIIAALRLPLKSHATPSRDAHMYGVVETRSGKLRGGLSDGVAAFEGVPYAAPPLWREPTATAAAG